MDQALQSDRNQGKWFVQSRDSRRKHHPTQLERDKFKVLFQLNCKRDTLSPSPGFFNEVTKIKEKRFKKNSVSAFPAHPNVRSMIKGTKDKDSRHRQA